MSDEKQNPQAEGGAPMSETLSKNERVDLSAVRPGHPIWEEVWKRCSPDADDHASHLDQLFEAKLQHRALVEALKEARDFIIVVECDESLTTENLIGKIDKALQAAGEQP
jgi:hypothetical protein